MPRQPYRAVLFDKDGTLTDFRATWEAWTAAMVQDLGAASGITPATIGAAVGLRTDTHSFHPDGLIVTAPFARTLEALVEATRWKSDDLAMWLQARRGPDPVPAGNPVAVFTELRGQGVRVGVLTNDSRQGAQRDLARLGLADLVDGLVAADDGHGAKPDPSGALAFAASQDLPPATVLVVGDGAPDETAALGAGMDFVGVLSGTRAAEDFHCAKAVLPDISALPPWLSDGR